MKIPFLVLLGLAACSPYNFQKEISAVGTGVSQLSDSFTAGYTQLAADRVTQLDLEVDQRARQGCHVVELPRPSLPEQPKSLHPLPIRQHASPFNADRTKAQPNNGCPGGFAGVCSGVVCRNKCS